MKKLLLFIFLFVQIFTANSQQSELTAIGREVKINLQDFTNKLKTANATDVALLPVLSLPVNNGNAMDFRVKESPIIENQPADIKTYSGETFDKRGKVRITITSTRFTAIIHIDNAYYFIEPIDSKAGIYRFYNMAEGGDGNCNVDGQASNLPSNNGRVLSIAPFPNGTQLRTYRMAGAATTNMTTTLGGQTQARDKIIEIVNANNLIYELEVSVRFSLITQTTTSMSLIFTGASNPADPFVIDPNFANAGNAQTGFNVLNTNSALPNGLAYNLYDVGHTFNIKAGAGQSASGQAGGSPCVDASKATGWTEFTTGATLGLIVNVYAHEVAHQFNAWHTFNAIGGNPDNITFCTGGWDANTAIEPGSGSTLMGYGGNCSTPTNYVLAAPNKETYFHTKSVEQIFNKMNTISTCFTSTATGNTPPVATAGGAFTIPKGTPFALTGSATDANATDILSYVWDEYDIATAAGDKGAFGATINGAGGYTAVNSTASAPLFRSRISASPTRMFPALTYILNNANAPALNIGEALPQASRTMNFRFTVRDNRLSGGGIDSDARVITVDATKGPFLITAPNGTENIAAGSSQTITWSVNGTNTLSANINISLSIDGGNSFPYILASNTANDGTETLTIPANVVGSTTCRVKIASTGNATAEFFDIADGNFTISSTCNPGTTYICPTATITNESGNAAFNLGLDYITANKITGNSKTYNTAGAGTFPVINYTDNTYTVCQASAWGNSEAVLVPFRVSQSGNYLIGATGAQFTGFSIFSTNTYNCANFVGGNTNGAISSNGARTITLNECTTYYALLYNFNNASPSITFSVQGTGDMLEILTNPVGFSYTYLAVNQANNQIGAISATSNFTTLGEGTYIVYGLQYANAVNPAGFVGLTIEQVYGSGSCLLFSAITKKLVVISSACPQTLTFTNPTNNITTGTVMQKANQTITATNRITGGNVTYQAGNHILMNPGFQVSGGAVYRTIGLAGCN